MYTYEIHHVKKENNMSKKYKKKKKQDNASQKEEMIEVHGTVVECLPGTQFLIELETGQTIIGHVAGKLRKFRIRILMGDYVKVELSPYDLTKGRIVRREKGQNNFNQQQQQEAAAPVSSTTTESTAQPSEETAETSSDSTNETA